MTGDEIQAIQQKLVRDMTVYERAVLSIVSAGSTVTRAEQVAAGARSARVAERVERHCLQSLRHNPGKDIIAEYHATIFRYGDAASQLEAAVRATHPHLLETR